MPYIIKKVDDGFKVCKKDEPTKCFSKKPLTKKKATKQMKAIQISEHLTGGNFPTFEEYAQSKGFPLDVTLSSVSDGTKSTIITKPTDKIEFDEAKFNELMKNMKTKEQYESLTKNRSGIQPYNEYKKTFEANARSRSTRNLGVEKRLEGDKTLIKLKGDLYADYIKEYPDAVTVLCPIDADGNRVDSKDKMEYTTKAECKQRFKKNERVENSKSFFGKAVNALTDIADFAVDNLPIIPEPVKDIYKKFGPPTSKFSGSGVHLEGGLRPIIGRIGGKNLLKKEIVNNYFPKDYQNMIYVEPFIGGGSIFFYKEPSDKEIINDKDSKLIQMYKGFKKYDGEKISKDINGKYNKEKFNKILNSNPKSQYDNFIKNLILYKTSFFGKGLGFGKRPYIKSNMKGYKDRLKDVEILNQDYKDIIKKYDSPNTFFYLDPPYENSKGLYDYFHLHIKDIFDVLKNIKGKFLISYNNSKEAKKLFKNYHINYLNTNYANPNKGGQDIDVKEIIISNYNPKLSGSGEPKDMELYNKIKEEVYKKNPKHSLYRSALIQKIYQSEGGKYEEGKEPKMNIKKWFKQDWISLNDYLRGEKVACGNSNTEEKYNEYPLCKKYSEAKKLTPEQIKKLIEIKNELKEKHLITKKYIKK